MKHNWVETCAKCGRAAPAYWDIKPIGAGVLEYFHLCQACSKYPTAALEPLCQFCLEPATHGYLSDDCLTLRDATCDLHEYR